MKKIVAFVKSYWWLLILPLLAIMFLVDAVFAGTSWTKELVELFKFSKQRHAEELKQIQAAHEAEIEARKRAEAQHREKLEQIQREYEASKKQLDLVMQDRAEQLFIKHRNDPQKLAEELARATGFKIVLPED